MSNDKKNINFKAIGIMMVVQIALAWFNLNTSIGKMVLEKGTGLFNKILSFGNDGIAFVFGGLSKQGLISSCFTFNEVKLFSFLCSDKRCKSCKLDNKRNY
ncbi:nucleoside permease NupC [Neobacillus ginsengisoli]|uniref:Nucleoside permease NupC n=2 Tax=Neobacillus ginsengisoli TaxID=904295 RepID=A0ABT9XQC2_9BACI|nr:nucleoside permease NupC [Neobacillus ginsengisoli]